MLVNLNGTLVPQEKAVISVFDHGLLYGDGVFEGVRAYQGRVFRLGAHLERLYDSAKAILLNPPLPLEAMRKEILRTLAANGLKDAYIRPVFTRGVGDLGLNPMNCPQATYFIITDRIRLYPEATYRDGLPLITVPTRRNVAEALSPKIKSLNYLNNILAKVEACQRGALEAILLTQDGYVAECTADNLFILRKGRLLTPPTWQGALEGVTRQAVLELAAKRKVPACEEPITRYDIYTAQEAFMTGTAAEIVPVTSLDGRSIGDGEPGPLTKRLMADYKGLTRSEGDRIPAAARAKGGKR
ncbi:MAG TPA: branched-chain-amino-acid transaminase [bacterium]|jgi:branched-chain amino acid aminotransferase|nr:branched-chain-amino-acid transaminase [bacterium]